MAVRQLLYRRMAAERVIYQVHAVDNDGLQEYYKAFVIVLQAVCNSMESRQA